MSLFLLFFFIIYSFLHLFFYSRVKVVVPRGMPRIILGVLLGTMIVMPIGVRLLERNDFDLIARIFAFAGYSWMGFLFLADCLFLLTLVLDLLLRIGIWAHMPISTMPQPTSAVVVLVLTSCIWVYGYVEARNIRIERITIENERPSPGEAQLKIAQISDVHLGLLNRTDRLQRIMSLIRSEKPDMLVCTGDLVDGNMGDWAILLGEFDGFDFKYGKYAVIGNHEVYAGLDQSLLALREFGFRVLRGEVVTVENMLNIAGVDDPAVRHPTDERALLGSMRNGLFTLLLKHRPAAEPSSLGLFDLQLSGHTHRGQIFPFSLLSARIYPMQDGLYYLENGSRLYTSRGTGSWGPPIRVLSPPEVTLITISGLPGNRKSK